MNPEIVADFLGLRSDPPDELEIFGYARRRCSDYQRPLAWTGEGGNSFNLGGLGFTGAACALGYLFFCGAARVLGDLCFCGATRVLGGLYFCGAARVLGGL